MAETADHLLTILEGLQQTNRTLVESLQQMLSRQEAEHQAFLGALQRLDASLQAHTQALVDMRTETRDQGRTLGEMLVQLGEALSRTERMTAGVLSRLDNSTTQ